MKVCGWGKPNAYFGYMVGGWAKANTYVSKI